MKQIIRMSLNSLSRDRKLDRLAHERSEDLLTWNVFSWLEDRDLLDQVLRLGGLGNAQGGVRIFYWGFNDRYDLGLDLPSLLTQTFREAPERLSEPDVMLVTATSLAIIEAKFGSPDDYQTGRDMEKYVGATPTCFGPKEDVEAASFYELTRYWAIGHLMAKQLGKRFALLNLVREGQESEIERSFGKVLRGAGTFRRVTWEQLAWLVDPGMVLHMRSETLNFERAFSTLI